MNGDKERQRLIDHMRAWLDALAARDFRGLKFAPGFRNTENTVELPVGVGLCRTLQRIWDDGHYFVDVATGQVEYWGVADEPGRETVFAVRLKVAGNLIAEAETMTARGKGEYFVPSMIATGTPGFHDVLPPEQRISREALIEVAHLYFDGIERSDGSIVPSRPDALRLVNGKEDAGDTADLDEDRKYRALSVQEQISKGYYSYIEALRGRRAIVADVERGIVLFHVMFDHPADHSTEDGTLPWPDPNTVMAFEAFKVVGGEIQTVWAIGAGYPYGIRSGWGDGDLRRIAALS